MKKHILSFVILVVPYILILLNFIMPHSIRYETNTFLRIYIFLDGLGVFIIAFIAFIYGRDWRSINE